MKELVLHLLNKAIHDLYVYDKRNIQMDVSEPNLCARLAYHLENLMREYDLTCDSKKFECYYVDVEYNRMEGSDGNFIKKQVIYDNQLNSVLCDLLIHSRDAEHCNLLALEMKKDGNTQGVDTDKKRLMALVKPKDEREPNEYVCDTLLGVYLVIKKSSCDLEVYEYDDHKKKVVISYTSNNY